jgi:type IV pilus assembly protein PilX
MSRHNHLLNWRGKHAQSGVVLFIAMVALVVLSLAAVALIRSVDTNSLITGNLSYKQTAATSSSYGVESMADQLGISALAYSTANDATNGYYAVCTTYSTAGTCNGVNLTADASWVPGTTSRLATGLGITAGKDLYGNTVQYIVERMCNAAGTATKSICMTTSTLSDKSSKNVPNGPPPPPTATDAPIYRVTVRVAGPKNTLSYTQAFIY